MKKYAVFAKKTEEYQKDDDYTIWHFLNDTDDLGEAYSWKKAAEVQKEKYTDVQIVKRVYVYIMEEEWPYKT
ncbi:hypothetical protein LJC07_04815 [Christensenellaceae bacterium OttesenSCG-928-L17]|nr:hypothetical protein [Christensenellaceae bacterium OttesenSCG-928-L17]